MRKLRIVLSIDGGGIRGVLPLSILKYIHELFIEEKIASSINERLDLLAGTSTGAIISAALMLDDGKKPLYIPEDIINLYSVRGEQIFSRERPEKRNEYPLKLILESSFGDLTLCDLQKHFLFVSYDQDKKKPFIFHDRLGKYRELPLAKVLLACSAVPGYFPPVPLEGSFLSDGIQTAKNPALLALKHAENVFHDDTILLLSIGTGELPDSLFDKCEEHVFSVEKELKLLAANNDKFIYHRLQPKIEKGSFEMDDSSSANIKNLLLDGEKYIEENKSNIKGIVEEIKKYG